MIFRRFDPRRSENGQDPTLPLQMQGKCSEGTASGATVIRFLVTSRYIVQTSASFSSLQLEVCLQGHARCG